MKVSKKIVSIALAVMLVLLCCGSAFAAENSKTPAGAYPPGTACDIDVSNSSQFLGYLEFTNEGYRLWPGFNIIQKPGDYFVSLHGNYRGALRIVIAPNTKRDVNIVFRGVNFTKTDAYNFIQNNSGCNVNLYFENDNVVRADSYNQATGTPQRLAFINFSNQNMGTNGKYLPDGKISFYSFNNSLSDKLTMIYMFGSAFVNGSYDFNGGSVTLVQDRNNNNFGYESDSNYVNPYSIATSDGKINVNDGKVVCARVYSPEVNVNGGEFVVDNDTLPAYMAGDTVFAEEYQNKTESSEKTALRIKDKGTLNVTGGSLTVAGGTYDKYQGSAIGAFNEDNQTAKCKCDINVTGGTVFVSSGSAPAICDVEKFEISGGEVSVKQSISDTKDTVICDNFILTSGIFDISAPSENEMTALNANTYTLTGGTMEISAFNCMNIGSNPVEFDGVDVLFSAKNNCIMGKNIDLIVKQGKMKLLSQLSACIYDSGEIRACKVYDGIVAMYGMYGVGTGEVMSEGDVHIYGGNVHITKNDGEAESGEHIHFAQITATAAPSPRNAYNETDKVYQCVITGLTPDASVGTIMYGGNVVFEGKDIKADSEGLLSLWLPNADDHKIMLSSTNTVYDCADFEETMTDENVYSPVGSLPVDTTTDTNTNTNTNTDTSTEEPISDGEIQTITLFTGGAVITVDGVDYNETYTFETVKGEEVALPTPVLEGKTFKEWNTAMDGSGIGMKDTMTSLSDKNVTLYAIFEGDDAKPMYGDVNCDGQVTMEDVTSLQKIIANLTTYESYGAMSKINADCNGDGQGTMIDVTLIQKYLAQLITSLEPTAG